MTSSTLPIMDILTMMTVIMVNFSSTSLKHREWNGFNLNMPSALGPATPTGLSQLQCALVEAVRGLATDLGYSWTIWCYDYIVKELYSCFAGQHILEAKGLFPCIFIWSNIHIYQYIWRRRYPWMHIFECTFQATTLELVHVPKEFQYWGCWLVFGSINQICTLIRRGPSTVKIRPDIFFPHCLLFLRLRPANMASLEFWQ